MKDLKRYCMVLYGVFAVSAVMQFSQYTMLQGLALLVMAYLAAEIKKGAAENTAYASHLRWLTRTFWIGTGVIVPAAAVLATVAVWFTTDVSSLASSADPDALMGSIFGYLAANMKHISLIILGATVPTTIWWLRRCWVGYALAEKEKPVENATSWL